MIQLDTLHIQHFKSFREPQLVQLANQGLVLIEGENKISRAADSNGAGKTSIVDALTWGLFGETLSGLKGAAVANRHTTEPCRVVVDWTNGTVRGQVVRQVRPNAVSVTLGVDTWRNAEAAGRVEAALGFGARTFFLGACFGQGGAARFATAPHPEQLRTLDEIHGIDFRRVWKHTTEWGATWNTRLATALAEVQRAEDAVNMAEVAYRDAQARAAAAAAERAARVKAARAALDSTTATHHTQRAALDAARATAARLPAARSTVAAADEAVSLAAAGEGRARMHHSDTYAALQKVNQAIAQLKPGAQCPACRQRVPSAATLATLWAAERTAAMRAVKEAAAVVQTALTAHAAAIRAQGAVVEERKLVTAGTVAVAELPRLQVAVEQAATAVVSAQTMLEMAETPSPGENTAALRAAVAKARSTRATAQRDVQQATTAVAVAEYWRTAYGDRGIRVQLFRAVSQFLTARTREHLRWLAPGDVAATVATDLVRGLEKVVLSTEWTHGAGAPDAASGGQARRVHLALFAALHDLAAARAATLFPIAIYDEPSDALDERGRELLCEWIITQAKRTPTTLVITHDTALEGLLQPSAIWRVVLDRNGSRVEIT